MANFLVVCCFLFRVAWLYATVCTGFFGVVRHDYQSARTLCSSIALFGT